MERLEYQGYIGSIEYNRADNCFHGQVLGLNKNIGIIYEGRTTEEFYNDFKEGIEHYLDDCKADGTCTPARSTSCQMDKRLEYMNILRRFKQDHAVEYGITSIGIFGSVARGDHTEESDVDVLVEAPEMDLFTSIHVRNQLEELMGVPVDLVSKSKFMRPRFKTRVEKEVIYV